MRIPMSSEKESQGKKQYEKGFQVGTFDAVPITGGFRTAFALVPTGCFLGWYLFFPFLIPLYLIDLFKCAAHHPLY